MAPFFSRKSFLDKCQVLNLNLGWILSAGCLVDTDFYDRLLVSTIGPLLLLTLVLASYFAAKHRLPVGDRAEQARVTRAHASIIFWVSLLIYASVSATIFQTFACDRVETGDLRGSTRSFLRADHRIDCDSARHDVFRAYAGIMCLVYPFGIPFCYFLILYRERATLLSSAEGGREVGGEAAATVTATDSIDFARVLWRPYRPQAFYFEVVECLRRVMLSGLIVFILPNTAGQVVTTFLMSLFFFAVLSVLNPYASRWDAWLAGVGHVVVMVSMFVALLMKVDTEGENSFSQDVFAWVLVATTCGMLVAVAVEACWMCRAALAE